MNSHDRVPICAGNSSYIKIVSNDFKLPSAVKMLGKKLFLINNKILLISREFIQHSDSSKTSVHFPLTILPIYFFLNRWLHFLHYLENSQNFEVFLYLLTSLFLTITCSLRQRILNFRTALMKSQFTNDNHKMAFFWLRLFIHYA